MAMACMTCPVMSGNGYPTGFQKIITANRQRIIQQGLHQDPSGYCVEVDGTPEPVALQFTGEMLSPQTGSTLRVDSVVLRMY